MTLGSRELVTAVFRVPASGRGAWVAAVCGPSQGARFGLNGCQSEHAGGAVRSASGCGRVGGSSVVVGVVFAIRWG